MVNPDFLISFFFIKFCKKVLILEDLGFLSEITLTLFINGALGQTRTGTPQAARILSLLPF
jgi:hypothetical protein